MDVRDRGGEDALQTLSVPSPVAMMPSPPTRTTEIPGFQGSTLTMPPGCNNLVPHGAGSGRRIPRSEGVWDAPSIGEGGAVLAQLIIATSFLR